MNQQRQRRFSYLSKGTKQATLVQLQNLLQDGSKGEAEPILEEGTMEEREEEEETSFDSVSITPGTRFMSKVSSYLEYLIRWKMQTDVKWRSFEIFLSGSHVPGEGFTQILEDHLQRGT
jgi:5'-3' exonuclease